MTSARLTDPAWQKVLLAMLAELAVSVAVGFVVALPGYPDSVALNEPIRVLRSCPNRPGISTREGGVDRTEAMRLRPPEVMA